MKICVVTATVGERRPLLTPDVVNPNVDYVCFSDREIQHKVWRVVPLERIGGSNNIEAKKYKVLIHNYVDCDASIWVDRHCRIMCDPEVVFSEFSEDLALINHYRNCIYMEGRACRSAKKDDIDLINRTCKRFRSEGWKPRSGLYYGGFVARKHTKKAAEFSDLWWEYINYGTFRDQISLPVAIKRSGISRKIFSRSRRNGFFRVHSK